MVVVQQDMFSAPPSHPLSVGASFRLHLRSSNSEIDFYIQSYCSTRFYSNVSKHKSLYFQLTFKHNQFNS